eukprot:Skav210696  [mRNA]  locus=scaffold1240:44844:46619:+ [translate_table: standard]
MHSLKAFAQSTLGELKDALVDAVGDDDEDEDEDVPHESIPGVPGSLPEAFQAEATSERHFFPADGSEAEARAEAAQIEFRAVQGCPFLENFLSQLNSEKAKRGNEWKKDSLSTSQIATLSCWTLRQVLPLVPASNKTNEAQTEPQRLLTSFSERYETLLAEHAGLQSRARELSLANADLARSAQQADAWKSAHGTAIKRLEELSSENAELKERIRSVTRLSIDADQEQQSKSQLLQTIAQKDAEILALGEAMEKLQEVVDDQNSLVTKCWNLERKLEAKEAKQLVTGKGEAEASREDRATRESDQLRERCRHAEKELTETSAALEALLEEKSRRLEDQEHLVDRRLVTSMLALYHDHVSSGQRALADQVLTQALHVLGGVPEETQRSRQQVKAAAAAAEARLAEPLGNAFLDFLEKEAEVEKAHATGTVQNTLQASRIASSIGVACMPSELGLLPSCIFFM